MQKKSNGAGHADNCKCSFCRPPSAFDKIFPNWRKVLRNSVAVGIIAGVANFQNIYPPNLEMIYTVIAGFVIAFGVEFANAYKHKEDNPKSKKAQATFFLS